MRELSSDHKALKGHGSTIFLKQVKSPSTVTRMLQPASVNSKLGKGEKVITKGKWKGMPMYSLSLEERATCPTSCSQWRNCYGNNMPFANRINHKDASFLPALRQELILLNAKHSGGFVVRLHVLGDFYSVPYVKFWETTLSELPGLRIFGYTHRDPKTPIGKTIQSMNSDKCWIRWSDRGGLMSANTDQNKASGVILAEGIHCPEQTGKTASCLTCGLCWSTPEPIRFSIH